MIETMYDCYLSQFNCMRNILKNREDLFGGFSDYYKNLTPDRLYLLGSGTSRNACAASVAFFEKTLEIETSVIIPSSIGRIHGRKPLVIAVSQSGRSTNTINAINKIKADGVPVVTLTDPIETPVGDIGDFSVCLSADNELIGPRTRGYTATMLTLNLMSLMAGVASGTIGKDACDEIVEGYVGIFEKGEEYYRDCQSFYDLHFNDLSKARKYVFTGKGVASKVADECALKVLETLCYPAAGYEYEEFLHGPACFADEELALFIFLSDDEDRERMLKTAGILENITPNCYVISTDSGITGDKVLRLISSAPAYADQFLFGLFGQLISAKLTNDLRRTRHPGVKNIFSEMGTKA